MITPLFLSIPPGTTYEQLAGPLAFIEDFAGVSNWVMRLPRVIYASDLRSRHTFTTKGIHVQRINQANLDQRWKYFVITKGDGKRYYCTAQVYYEKGPIKVREGGVFTPVRQVYRQFMLPKCLVLLSELPYYKIQVNLLKVFKQLKRQEPIISHSVSQNMYRIYLQLCQQGREREWDSIAVRETAKGRLTTPPIEFTFNYYITMCNEHRVGETIFLEKNTNREVLHLYKLQTQSFYELSYFFHLPFTPHTLRQIISAIFMEKQIIFASNNSNLTTLVIETIMRMILPFKWCYMYVPSMPAHLLQAAKQCFMPFIAGIPKKYLSQLDTSDKVVVSIQEDKVIYSGQLYLIHSSLTQYLIYLNSDNKNYLEWQKQISIKALLLVHSLIEECMAKDTPQTQRSLHNSIVSLGGSQAQLRYMQRYPSSGLLQQQTHRQFIDDLVTNSMMFKHFKQDNSRGLADQTIKLIQLPIEQRRSHLFNKFNTISSQAQYPVRYNNQRKWIRYYDRINNNRKKYRFNRYSLNGHEGSTLNSSIGFQSNNSIVGSPHFVESRMALTHSTVFH